MKVVLAYSGGLDTSVILKWLQEEYKAKVVCFCADLGQEEELTGLDAKARKCGAVKSYIEDLREEFVRDFVFPMLQANAIYEGCYLLGTSIARPLIAKRLVEIAVAEKAEAICHGATGKGNDQVRFEITAYAMKPDIRIIAPWRLWKFKSRTDLINYCQEKKIPITVTAAKPYSMDRNLLHISFEGGILEDPWAEAPEEMSVLTQPISKTPDTDEQVTVEFKKGIPVAVNGKKLSPAKLLATLNRIGGKHGVGRVDMVENRFVGMKSRGVYETPGGTILHTAHRAMESICMDREVMHLRDSWIPKYASLIYNGFWFAPEREMLQVAITKSQENVTGEVRVKLFKGNCRVVGRRSPNSLYNPELATFEADRVYNQADAEGFIRLNALRLRVGAMARKKQAK
ncbi:MAG: argininosuccinate synthase [Lentisphaerae bacterium RIFOXYB12_FULL_65_16]|nr:MAG: argininosuccinate synthase [Lentisphaerae bacterium RIFOXYA12_64_32]OGV93178.1 MAG: argininosuccinate synthase [Lentisphaerae bacterium RIFOXYB12_FULL_65_16]